MNINSFKLGMSIAFSHGTANALIFGMHLLQTKGFYAFLLWAIPNTICMSIFGWIYHKGWLREQALSNPLVKIVMILLQCSMLLFQMKLLQTYFSPLIGSDPSFVLASIIAGVFVLWMFKNGLSTSIRTDNWQGWATIGTIAVAIAYCGFNTVPMNSIPATDSPNWLWGLWSTAVYVSAIIADLQHWRRGERDTDHTAFHWATAIFAVLMILVGTLGMFQLPYEVKLALIIPVLGLATSTVDSIAVSLHECYNKYVGTALAMVIVCFWWLLLSKDAVWVWNGQGVIRCTGAVLIILWSIWYWIKHYRYKKVA